MKRGCLVAVGVSVLAVVLGALGGIYWANTNFGILPAPDVPVESVATAGTRFRAYVDPVLLEPLISKFIPYDDIQLPDPIKGYLKSNVKEVLPHGIAVLGGANFAKSTLDFTVFINEHRGGPFLVQVMREAKILRSVPNVTWAPEGIQMRGRGTIAFEGSLPMPDGLEEKVLQHWTHSAPAKPFTTQGGHQFEIAFDNRNGDLMSVIAVIVLLNGKNWEDAMHTQEFAMSENIITGLVTGRLTADLVDEDTVNIRTELQATPDSGPGMPFLLGVAMGPLQALAKSEAGLTLTGAPTWDAAKELVVGDYRLTGMKAIFDKYVAKPKGGPQPAANTPPRKPTEVPKAQ